MTISNQLNDVKTIKANIKQAIENQGVTVASDTAFSDYPSKIGEIEGGPLQAKTLTAGADTADTTVITPDSNYYGLSSVTVDLSYISDRLNALAGNGVAPVSYGPDREISANGVYQMPSSNFTFSLPSNATCLGAHALDHAFPYCTSVISADLSSLTTINGEDAMYNMFYFASNLASVDLSNLVTISSSSNNALWYAFAYCQNLTSVDLSSLTTVSGPGALSGAFSGCQNLTSVDLSSLTTVNGSSSSINYIFNGCQSLTSIDLSSLTTISGYQVMACSFMSCSSLTSIDLSSLATITGDSAMQQAFYGTSLTSLSFPSLTSTFNVPTSGTTYTTQFKQMLQGVTGCTVHFPSNLQSVIGSWSDVTAGFGGTNTTVLFDLPATT